jgi:hypothetical protein
MTKVRDPGSIGDAITKIAVVLGWERMAEIANVGVRAVRNWSDDGSRQTPPVAIAMKLDAAYVAEGGGEPPILTAYSFGLELAARPLADLDVIVAATQSVIKEGAEGAGALAAVIQQPKDQLRRRTARRECLEAAQAYSDAAQLLDDGGGA